MRNRCFNEIVLLTVGSCGLLPAETLTRVQQAIVNSTRNVSGASPSSHTSFAWNGTVRSGWGTDTDSNDGTRIRAAINRYAAWRPGHAFQSIPASLIAAMKTDIVTYKGNDGTQMVNQITYTYDLAMVRCMCIVATPQDNEQTLAFLSIRQQCKEWVDGVVIRANGIVRAYGGSGVQTIPANFRPGMGLYFPALPSGGQHSSIITDVIRLSTGAIQFRIAESNWGTGGWMNPGGMIPWGRTLQNTRVLDWLGNNTCRSGATNYTCQVVSFE